MALAPYFSRVSDAVASLTSITGPELAALLGNTVVRVDLAPETEKTGWQAGVALLGNLLGRLYPRLTVTGPPNAVALCAAEAQRSNPLIDLAAGPGSQRVLTLKFGMFPGLGEPAAISVTAHGWRVAVDEDPASVVDDEAPQTFATLAAACIGAGELFRAVFAEALGARSRRGPQPGVIDLISGDASDPAPAADLRQLILPPMYLAGAGAVGQACAHAFATSGVRGEMTVVDPESLELTNVQRYVLSAPSDVGVLKTELVARTLAARGWKIRQVPTRWGADTRTGPGRDIVLVALDTPSDRLGVAAGLHHRVYNAWTQPDDIGWSRHENFGVDPCLACLYYPDRPRPSDDELIAAALHQDRLRVLSYLVTRVPVGLPLPGIVAVADLAPPPDAERWTQVPLLADLLTSGLVAVEQQSGWAQRTVAELYTAGICGGGLVYPNRQDLPGQVVVPLAHQSALAGILLALQPVAAALPDLAAARFDAIEGRLDLLRGLPQVLPRPRERTAGCFCADPAFLAAAPRH